jgi:hypothetical protein
MRLWQEVPEFQDSLGCIVRLCLKKKKKNPGAAIHAYNPRYMGDRDWEDHDWLLADRKSDTSSQLPCEGDFGIFV